MAALLVWIDAAAQTPVEELIVRYGEVKGARSFVARGTTVIFARGLLRNYELAPIANKVEELYVLRMGGASRQEQDNFMSDLKETLKVYEYYGMFDGKEGLVDIYVTRCVPDTVSELVIYNPELWSLNSLEGNFSVSSLLSLVKDDPAEDISE